MQQAIFFLVEAVVGFFTALFLLRFAMQCLRTSFAGPFGQFVVKLTNWAVLPLRKVIPGLGGLDWASLIAAFVMQLGVAAFGLLWLARIPSVDGATLAGLLAWAAVLGLLRLTIQLLIGVLLVQAILSWVAPYSPIAGPLNQLTRPILAPIRRILPPISGIDLSPLVAIVLAQALLYLL